MSKMAAEARKTGERESSFCNRTHSDDLASAIFRQKQQWQFCDVLIKVCGREICAHSTVLAAVSPYFASFFGQDLPRRFSQKCPQMIEIQIDGCENCDSDYETVVDSVIEYAYTGVIWVTENSVTRVLEIARIMQLDDIILFCEDLISNKVSSNNQLSRHGKVIPSSHEGVSSTLADKVVRTDEIKPHRTLLSNLSNVHQGFGLGNSSRSRSVKMNSISTQVRPSLLGIRSCLGETKNQSTSTDMQILWNFEKQNGRIKKKRKFAGNCAESDADSVMVEDKQFVNISRAESSDRFLIKGDLNAFGTHFAVKSENSDPADSQIIQQVLNVNEGVSSTRKCLNVRHSSRVRRRPLKLLDDGELDLDRNCELASSNVSVLTLECLEQGGNRFLEDAVTQEEGEIINRGTVSEAEIVLDGSSSVDLLKLSLSAENKRPKLLGRTQERKKFRCSSCAFATNNVRLMSTHNKLHKMSDNICYYCDLKFEERKSMELHMLEHSNQTMPFFCRFCRQHFQSRTQLMLHLPKHSDEKPYICEVCSIGFKWKNALKNHMITHENRKEHLCDICGYATAHRCQLKAHRLVHTGETIRCTHEGCNYHATKAQNLKYHMLTHTQVKAHQCEVCGTSFSLVKNLKRHMLLHTSQKTHKCEHCDFASTRYDKLKEHLHKQHSIGTAPEKRMRITDMVHQSRTIENILIEGPNNDSGEFKSSLDVESVVEPSNVKSDLEIFYCDDYTMLELPDGLRVDVVEEAIHIFPSQKIIIARSDGVTDLSIQSGVTVRPFVSLTQSALDCSAVEIVSRESAVTDCVELCDKDDARLYSRE